MKGKLTRIICGEHQTTGEFKLYNDDNELIFYAKSMELAWNNNAKNISCIPTGTYNCKPRYSDKFKDHYILENVPNRDYILIHPANYNRDLRGCIGLGKSLVDIDGDGDVDITDSRNTIHKFIQVTNGEEFKLTITD